MGVCNSHLYHNTKSSLLRPKPESMKIQHIVKINTSKYDYQQNPHPLPRSPTPSHNSLPLPHPQKRKCHHLSILSIHTGLFKNDKFMYMHPRSSLLIGEQKLVSQLDIWSVVWIRLFQPRSKLKSNYDFNLAKIHHTVNRIFFLYYYSIQHIFKWVYPC